MYRLCRGLVAAFVVMTLLTVASVLHASAELFPRFAVIEPNVAFWVDIYSQYTTRQAVIHDSHDLRVVYEVISIKPYDAPGALKTNRDRMKRAKAKYEAILGRLATDPRCKDEDCRRVAGLFGPQADAGTFRRARHQVRSQIGQKDRFQAGVIRSGAYLDEIRSILKSYGVPEDLAYLPHVESSFNLAAYSKFGAAGIWQFTRSTGRRFMSVDYVLDERRDPIRATHAAAQLLKENHQKLGSWPLAITAYNHGAAGMARAREKHGDYPAVFTSYRSRTFKFASRNFYSEFLAARQVAADHTAYFGPLALDSSKPSHSVTLEGYVRFEDLCAHYGVVPDVLREMNPALRPPVFNDQKYVPKGYQLRLPYEIAARGTVLAAIPSSLMKSAQRPSRFYTVQKGDTAGQIARRHGVRLTDLILANNLNTRATIYPRQTLRIPLPGEKVTPPEPQTPVIVAPETPVLVAALEKQPPETVAPAQAGRAATNPPPAEVAQHEQDWQPIAATPAPAAGEIPELEGVEAEPVTEEPSETETATTASSEAPMEAPETPAPAGEDLSEPPVAEATTAQTVSAPSETAAYAPGEVPEAEVMPAPAPDETPETPAALEGRVAAWAPSVGQAPPPAIPATVMPNTEIVSIEVRFDRLTEINREPVGILQVEVEETLGHFAEWAGVRTQQIRNLNGLRFGRTLHLHQKIKIPLDKVDAAAFEEQRYEYHKRLQEDFFAVYRVAELEPYRVQPGDTIWTLCREKFGVPMWLLKHYNMDVDLADLGIQQKLMMPVIQETTAGEPGTVTNGLAPDEEPAGSPENDPA